MRIYRKGEKHIEINESKFWKAFVADVSERFVRLLTKESRICVRVSMLEFQILHYGFLPPPAHSDEVMK
jgi:hypothetical protein